MAANGGGGAAVWLSVAALRQFFGFLPTKSRYFPRNFPPEALRGKGAPAGQRPPWSGETPARLRPMAVLAGHRGLVFHMRSVE